MKRFAVLLAFLSLYVVPASAQLVPLSYRNTTLEWHDVWMRHTNAGNTVARQLNWAFGAQGQPAVGFIDSLVFRHATQSPNTVYDTTAAYRVDQFPMPPTTGYTTSNAVGDTSSLPWLIVRVRQDTTRANWSGAAGLDSIRVGAEYSNDGINWFSCSGTPTQRFDTIYFTSGQDGLQNPSLIGVEGSPGEDAAFVVLRCHPSQATTNAFIVNRTLCFAGSWVRFLIGLDGSGQFRTEIATWAQTQ